LDEFRDDRVIYLPIEEDTTLLLYEFVSKNSYSNLCFSLPERRQFNITRNKKRTAEFCRQRSIPVPEEFKKEDIQKLRREFRPVVVKPRTGRGAEGLFYVNSPRQLRVLETMDWSECIVQEKIGNWNEVQGGFYLFDRGKLISFYSHRRIRTYPPSGGVTVYSRLDCDEKIKELGESLLGNLDWSGLAMIEFLYDYRKEEYKVIEINPRLWGSFLLSEYSGAGFLRKYVETAVGHSVSEKGETRGRVYIRWFFPFDLLNYFLSLGRIKGFWDLNTRHTCYINFTYSRIWRSIVFLVYLNFGYLVALFKETFRLK
jgi:predicted ATP-grasp superfamily ATP-dependent carboligase